MDGKKILKISIVSRPDIGKRIEEWLVKLIARKIMNDPEFMDILYTKERVS